MARPRGRPVVLVILFVLAAGAASAQEIAYTGGVHFATGRYLFDTRTNSVYVLTGVEMAAGPVRLSGSIPVVLQTTPWITYGPVPVPSGGRLTRDVVQQLRRGQRRIALPATGQETHGGFGDPLLRGDVELLGPGVRRTSLRLGASAKPPVASTEHGLGTGAWDYGAGMLVSTRAGVHSVSVDVAYWHIGDLDDLPLANAWAYGVAYGRTLTGGRWVLLASASGFSTIIEGQDPPLQAGVGLGRVFTSGHALTGTVSFGVTSSAPAVSVGLGWRLSL
jgi:hypothetical protein